MHFFLHKKDEKKDNCVFFAKKVEKFDGNMMKKSYNYPKLQAFYSSQTLTKLTESLVLPPYNKTKKDGRCHPDGFLQ